MSLLGLHWEDEQRSRDQTREVRLQIFQDEVSFFDEICLRRWASSSVENSGYGVLRLPLDRWLELS